MVQEIDGAHGLWVHQESVIIAAESHDIWSFTPEFLMSNGFVPSDNDWACTRATRSADDVTIRYGPVNWWMTESNLWVTSYPDCPIKDDLRFEGDHIVPSLARRYIETVPYLPARRLWHFWRLSVVKPSQDEWMLNTFLHRGLPTEFQYVTLQPTLGFVANGVLFQISIKTEELSRRNDTFEDSTSFECYASSPSGQGVDSIILEADDWLARLDTFKQAINHLLEEGGQ